MDMYSHEDAIPAVKHAPIVTANILANTQVSFSYFTKTFIGVIRSFCTTRDWVNNWV